MAVKRLKKDPDAPKKLSPFDFVNTILQSKTDLMKENPAVEKEYLPFIVNRALSFHSDTVKLANAMNRYPDLPKIMQYQFLLNTVSARRRPYSPWMKAEADDTITLIADYYGISHAKAREVVKLHTPEQLEHMRMRLTTGGMADR